jgi:hypothetical protein
MHSKQQQIEILFHMLKKKHTKTGHVKWEKCSSFSLYPQMKSWRVHCTPKNEGKRVHVPPDEKTCGHAECRMYWLVLLSCPFYGKHCYHLVCICHKTVCVHRTTF